MAISGAKIKMMILAWLCCSNLCCPASILKKTLLFVDHQKIMFFSVLRVIKLAKTHFCKSFCHLRNFVPDFALCLKFPCQYYCHVACKYIHINILNCTFMDMSHYIDSPVIINLYAAKIYFIQQFKCLLFWCKPSNVTVGLMFMKHQHIDGIINSKNIWNFSTKKIAFYSQFQYWILRAIKCKCAR